MLAAMDQLGMPLYGCLTPDGYKNTEDAWLSPDATTRRIGFATALARGDLPLYGAKGAAVAHSVDAAPLQALLGSSLTEATRRAILEAPQGLRAALVLGSPDFMRH
jgi:uncharacterized protein (DUF1800 family)